MKNRNNWHKAGIIVSALCLLPQLSRAQNPIISEQFTADPTARVFNNKVYLYPSHDIVAPQGQRQDWFCMADYHVYSTDNLTDWTDHGVILSQQDVPWGKKDGYSMWAPDCVYKNGKYYFYFPDAPQEGKGFAVGVATANHPEGPFTCLPQPIAGVMGIDPCVLLDDDGKAYIYWAGMGIRGAQLQDNMTEIVGYHPEANMPSGNTPSPQDMEQMMAPFEMKGLPEGFKEGPFAFKHKGKYYLTFPWVRKEKGTETLAYAMSDNPLGPWDFKGIIMSEHANGCWTNHHSIVNYQGQWYLFYHHNDLSPHFDKNRSVCIDKLTFNADGTIQEVKPTFRGVGISNATQPIQIDRYSSLKGNAKIDYIFERMPQMGWMVDLKKGASVSYEHVNFALAKQNMVIRAMGKGNASILVNGKKIATFDVDAPRWTEEYLKTDHFIKGIENLSNTTAPNRCIGNIEIVCNTGNVQIDWLRFLALDEEVPQAPKLEDYFMKIDGKSSSSQTLLRDPFSTPDEEGFIHRWLLLEPINKPNRSNLIFSYAFMQQEFARKDYQTLFKNMPKDGQTVHWKETNQKLKWHALDSKQFNTKLFRFASGLNKSMYGVLFWATTIVECQEDIPNVRLAAGSNGASQWWVNNAPVLTLESDRRMVKDDGMSQRLTLHKGKNIVRVAVINGPGMSDMCMRFVHESGKPVTNITIKTK